MRLWRSLGSPDRCFRGRKRHLLPLMGPAQASPCGCSNSEVHQRAGVIRQQNRSKALTWRPERESDLSFRPVSIYSSTRMTDLFSRVRWLELDPSVSHSLDWARFANAQPVAAQEISRSFDSAASRVAGRSCAQSGSGSDSFQSPEAAGSSQGNPSSSAFQSHPIACYTSQRLSLRWTGWQSVRARCLRFVRFESTR